MCWRFGKPFAPPLYPTLSKKPNTVMVIPASLKKFELPFLVISLLATILVIWRHRENVVRLIKGKEPRIGQP